MASHLEKASVCFLRSRKDIFRTKELEGKKSPKTDCPEAATCINSHIKKSVGFAQLIFENFKLPE